MLVRIIYLWTGIVELQTCSDWRTKCLGWMMIAAAFIILLGHREALLPVDKYHPELAECWAC